MWEETKSIPQAVNRIRQVYPEIYWAHRRSTGEAVEVEDLYLILLGYGMRIYLVMQNYQRALQLAAQELDEVAEELKEFVEKTNNERDPEDPEPIEVIDE